MRKLFLVIVLIIIAASTAQALESGYETFEDLVVAMENGETDTSDSQFGRIIMHTLETQNSTSNDNDFLNELNPKQGRVAAMQEITALQKYLKFNTDDIENITWVRSKRIQFTPYLEVYSGELNGVILLRLAAEVFGTTMLDVDQIILNIDGDIFRIPIDSKNSKISSKVRIERAPLSGLVTKVWYKERIDIPVSGSLQIMSILNKIPSSSNTAVRLHGRNGNVDFNMSSVSKNALSDVIRYYSARRTELL